MKLLILTTSVPNTHQMSYKNNPDNRMDPVLNESMVRKESALNENDKAKISVRRADLRDSLPPKLYSIEGSAPRGIR